MKHGRSCLLAVLAASLLFPRVSSASYDAIETPDLRLIYISPTLDFIAPYTVQCFENSLRFHRRLWNYTPSERVNVIMGDFGDYGNAGVWVNPRNSMMLDIAPVNFVYETAPSNERVNHTMNHEIVHVLALEKPAGRDRTFRRLFHGKVRDTPEHPETMLYSYLTVPRRASPRWYHEGIAVFMETWMAGGLGRAQSPYDEMVFRSMVADSTHIYDPLGLESEGTKIDFQVGVNSYLYGTRFMSYLAYTYSPEALIRWVNRDPGSKAYYATQFHKVYGLPLNEAWRNWIEWERGFQHANLDSIRLHPTTKYADLSRRALGSVSRAYYDPESREIYAGVFHPGAVAHIAAIPIDGRPIRKLCEVKGPALYFVTSLVYDPAEKMLYYTADNNGWRDLCVLDPRTGKSRVLIKDARLGDMAINPQDHSMWAVRHFNGISTLVRLQYPYKDWNQVFSWPYGKDIYDLDISPDGAKLSTSIAEVSGRQTLHLMDTRRLLEGDTTSTTLFDFGTAIPTCFSFSGDGRYLYGSSYYTGVSNIFRWNLGADSMEVVSNSETGFFRPLPISADSLIVFRYTGQGFVPAMIEPKPLADVSAITFLGNQVVEKYPVLQSWKVSSPATVNVDSVKTYAGPYKAWSQVRLSTLYPIVEGYKDYTALGMRFDVSDPIQLNTFELSASFTPEPSLPADERWHMRLAYRRYDVTAEFEYNGASFYDLVGPTKTSRKGYGAKLGYTGTLINDAPNRMTLDAGLAGYAGLEELPYAQGVSVSPGFDMSISPYAQVKYRNMRTSIGGVDYETGYMWQAATATNGVHFDYGDHAAWRGFTLTRAGLDVGTPLPIHNSSLWLRTAGGYSPGDRSEPFANFFFGGFGNNWVDHQEPKRYRDVGSFPGVGIDEIAGTTFGKMLVDWNLPPLRFRRVGTPTFYATWARMSLFTSALTTNFDSAPDRRTLGNIGGQIDIRFSLLTQQSLTLSFGYARAFEQHSPQSDETMVSLKIL